MYNLPYIKRIKWTKALKINTLDSKIDMANI